MTATIDGPIAALLEEARRQSIDLIRLSRGAAAVAEEHRRRSFEWVLPVELTLKVFATLLDDLTSPGCDDWGDFCRGDEDDYTMADYTDPGVALVRLAMVCKEWRTLAYDNTLWKPLFVRRIPLSMRNDIHDYLCPVDAPERQDTLTYRVLFARHMEIRVQAHEGRASSRCFVCNGCSWQACPREQCGAGCPYTTINAGCPWTRSVCQATGHAHCLAALTISRALHTYMRADPVCAYTRRDARIMVLDDATYELEWLRSVSYAHIHGKRYFTVDDIESYTESDSDDDEDENRVQRGRPVTLSANHAAVASCAHSSRRAPRELVVFRNEFGWPQYKDERGYVDGCCTMRGVTKVSAWDIWAQFAPDPSPDYVSESDTE